ncbi:unnamed protein product, partial [Polarella glacialis]
MSMSPDIMWQCVKKNSAFLRKSRNMPVMSAEPGNLCSLNSFKYSGLANRKVLDISPKIAGKKESIVLTLRHAKASRACRPSSMLVKSGVSKSGKKGTAAIVKVLSNRQDLLEESLTKYQKIRRSFKKKQLVGLKQGTAPWGDSFEMPELSHTSYGGVGCLVVLSAFFAAISVGSVEPLTYGIRYNGFNKYAEVDRVYHNGRYFIGPWNSFVLFPAVAQTIEFSNQPRLVSSGTRKDAHWHREGYAALHTRTKEGLALDLEVSLQYKLKENEVGLLYEEFNTNYQAMFTSTIRDTLIKAAAEYEAYQLWEERKQVGDRMQELVNEVLAVTYAECWGLQLLDISLPAEFDKSIVATQIQSQTIATMQYLQVATKTRAETRVIEAEFARKVKVIRAGARANYTLTTKVARAKAKQTILNAEASVLGQARTRLKL